MPHWLTFCLPFPFDQAIGLWDDRTGLFDGADVGKITAEWYIKTTNSDPTGRTYTDPIWSEWALFPGGVGDITARAYWLKLIFTSEDSSISFSASAINTNVQVGSRVESFTSQVISSGGTTLTYSKPFFSIPAFTYDIQSSVSGDTIQLSHITSSGKYTGVTAQILNGGSGVGRTINLYADGY